MNTGSSRIHVLTSLRFFAAIFVVYYHCWDYFALPRLGDVFSLSQAVSFFFVLSGFVLAHGQRGKQEVSWKRFYLGRLTKLWPPHLCAIALWFILSGRPLQGELDVPHGTWTLLANALLVQSYVPFQSVFFSLNAVTWSLSTEMFFYVVFPLIMVGWKRSGSRLPWLALGVSAAFVGVYFLVATQLALPLSTGPDTASLLGILVNPLTRLFEFCLGIFTYGLWSHAAKAANGAMSSARATLLELGALALACFSSWACVDGHLWHASTPALKFYLFWAGSAPAFAVLIHVFASGRGAVSRLLSGRLPVFLGEISFALYLVHYPVLLWFQRYPHAFQNSVQASLVYLAACLMLAYLLYAVVESSFRDWIMGGRGAFPVKRVALELTAGLATLTAFSMVSNHLVNSGWDASKTEVQAFMRQSDRIQVDAAFGSLATLVSMRVDNDDEGKASVEMLWKAEQDIPVGYRMALHMIDADGKTVAQSDERYMAGVGMHKGQYWIGKGRFQNRSSVLDQGGSLGVVVYRHVTKQQEAVNTPSADLQGTRYVWRKGVRTAKAGTASQMEGK